MLGSGGRGRPRPHVVGAASARRLVIDHQYDVEEVAEGVGQPWVGQLVSDLAPFGNGDDESASPQTGEVVTDIGPGRVNVISEIAGIARTFGEMKQDPRAGRIGKSPAHSTDRIEPVFRCDHEQDDTANTEFSGC